MNAEKLLVILVVFAFAFTSINMLVLQGNALTKEEAIEISRNSELVRSLLEDADWYTLEVHYLNNTQVWHIMWYIHPRDAVSAFRYVVSHIIDDETGEILAEGSMSAR